MSTSSGGDVCPVEHSSRPTGLALAYVPYATVNAAFPELDDPYAPDNALNTVAGRTRLEMVNPRSAEYHRESRFSDEQRAYFGIAIALLNN